MFVNIISIQTGWILQIIANRIKEFNRDASVRIEVTDTPDPAADVNYYVDFMNMYKHRSNYKHFPTNFDVAYFTHVNHYPKLDRKNWTINRLNKFNGYKNLKGIVSMNGRYTDVLVESKYPRDKIATIIPGQTYDQFELKKINIGIVSRGGGPQYGTDFIVNFLRQYDLTNFRFKFLGNFWDAVVPVANEKNIEVELTGDADYNVYKGFYETIDYLLIPGMFTAGPMSMQESLSCGVPIIAGDVGFVNYEFKSDYVYEPGNGGQLYKILQKILQPRLDRRKQVECMTWEKYAADLISFFKKLKGQ